MTDAQAIVGIFEIMAPESFPIQGKSHRGLSSQSDDPHPVLRPPGAGVDVVFADEFELAVGRDSEHRQRRGHRDHLPAFLRRPVRLPAGDRRTGK